ncbi:MAG TPA: PaaI family thioesterase [Vicinamibacterales bacterium]
MGSIGAVLEAVEAGTVTISCTAGEGLTQQHGLLHGGVIASLADVACGYAALSLMPDNKEVLTVEFKINFLRPATTERVVAVAKVVQSGRTLTVCEATVFDSSQTNLVARMTATMMSVDLR